MAWNPSPKVAAARDIGKKFGFDQVIIIGIDNNQDKMEAISYGSTRSACAEAKGYADAAYDAVFDCIVENI